MPNGPPVADDGCSMYCSGAIIPELCMNFSSDYSSDWVIAITSTRDRALARSPTYPGNLEWGRNTKSASR